MVCAMNQVAVIETDAVVATISRARAALAEAKTIQETKRIIDTAAAAEIYARRQKLGEEAEDLAHGIKIEALRKLGEMLAATERNAGAKGIGKSAVPKENHTPKLSDLGLTKKESAVAQKLASLPEKDFQQVRDGNTTVSKAIAAVDAINKSAVPKENHTQFDIHLVTPTGEVLTAADMGADDPLEMLKEMQQDLEAAHKQIEILTQDDTKAELHKMILQRDHAVRRQSEEMDKAFASQKREKRTKALLMRCGKAVGEDDPEKIPATVEAMARTVRKAA